MPEGMSGSDEDKRLEALKDKILREVEAKDRELVEKIGEVKTGVEKVETGLHYTWAALVLLIAVFGVIAGLLASAAGLF